MRSSLISNFTNVTLHVNVDLEVFGYLRSAPSFSPFLPVSVVRRGFNTAICVASASKWLNTNAGAMLAVTLSIMPIHLHARTVFPVLPWVRWKVFSASRDVQRQDFQTTVLLSLAKTL